LSALCGVLATAAAFREDWIPYIVTVSITVLVAMTILMRKSIIPLLLAASMAVPNFDKADAEEPLRNNDPNAVPIGAAVVVICVGGYCVYRLVKFCQKKFPKETNTNELTVRGGEEYGGAWNYGMIGSCYDPQFQAASVTETDATTFSLNVLVGQGGTLSTTMSTVSGEGTTQSFEEFQIEVAGHGLWVTGNGDNTQYFSINRVPCVDIECRMGIPISFDEDTKSVKIESDGVMQRVSIERSSNLVNWSPFLITDVAEGGGFRTIDTTRDEQMFYRVTVLQP
jgi:hypothetical protein